LITLTTDLDPVYVAQMKGAILELNPSARIIDISHDVGSFNVRRAGFVLMCAARAFPRNAVHVCVVDPGVGSSRRCLIVDAKCGRFVGPDNGVFTLALEGGEHTSYAIQPDLLQERTHRPISGTFHGRDIFAPVAALLDMGESPEQLAREVAGIKTMAVAKPARTKQGAKGEVAFVDGFGNLVTNIPEGLLQAPPGSPLKVSIGGKTFPSISASCYADAEPRQLIVLVGSQHTYEISINQGNASSAIGGTEGQEVQILLGR